MFKWLLIINAVSLGILVLPDWKPPYSYIESLIILLGYAGTLGVWFLLLALVLNRLVNINLRIR